MAQAGYASAPPHSGVDVGYLQSVLDALCDISLRDPLTGLANRRYFMSVLEQELDRVARSGEMALLLMVDIDFFKKVNDTHGHLVGDRVIKHIAQAILQSVRPMDTVARFGGEEFAVILPSCQPAFAAVVAERIREKVENTPIPLDSGEVLRSTVSCGGAFAPQWVRSSVAAWIERADAQLYRAKNSGRNRVCIEPQPESTVTAEEKSLLFGLVPGEPQ